MRLLTSYLGFVVVLASKAAAQYAILTDGNSHIPECAQSCPLLQQAAQACGGVTSATQTTWNCFCQSAYLKPLYSSPAGICDTTCTATSDNQQLMTWYTTNCGTDNGQSEHAGDVAPSSTIPSNTLATSTTAAGSRHSATAQPSSGGSSLNGSSSSTQTSWWDIHYRWVVMLIILLIAFLALGFGAAWLKRWYDRRQDRIHGGFNAGITSRTAGPGAASKGAGTMEKTFSMESTTAAAVYGGAEAGSGRNSAARSHDAYMPYGYGYTHGGSAQGSRVDVQGGAENRQSPLARGGISAEDVIAPVEGQKRIRVRERDER